MISATGEVPSLRTRTSRTFLKRRGGYRTVLATGPVNYRTRTGQWAPIDTRLVAQADGTYVNTADTLDASLPATAAGAVDAAEGSALVDERLLGAAPVAASVSGSTATYGNVYPGVSAVFEIRPDTVKQTLVLGDAGVPASYASRVTVAAGSTLRLEDDRSISVVAADGTVEGSLPAPWMQDASGDVNADTSTAVTYSISGASPNYTVTTTPSHAWLTDAARVFPVRIDPTVTFNGGGSKGCYYAGTGASDPTVCSNSTGTDNYLSYGQSGYPRRAYVMFPDLTGTSSSVPPDAVITNANLTMTELYQNNTTAMPTKLLRPSGSWGSTTTWATQPGTSGNEQDDVTVTPPGVGNTVTFNPVDAVRQWVRGEATNYGLVIRLKDESSQVNTLRFYGFANASHRPTLTVYWSPAVGQQRAVGAYDHRLSDRMDLHVDLATRNLVINGTDESMQGPGQSLVVRRTYNSLNAAAGQAGAFGTGWLMNGGVDEGITISREQVNVVRPSGAIGWFTRHFEQSSLTVGKNDSAAATNGPSFDNGPGWNADLEMPDSTHYTLQYRGNHEKETFTLPAAGASTGWLSKIDDNRGNTITYSSSGSPLQTTSATDATGSRSVNLTYTSGVVTGMAESLAGGATGARSWSYGYTGATLTTYTDPLGKVTTYCYTGNLITKIITPRGASQGSTCSTAQGVDVTDIAYDANNKVTSVSYENGTAPAITVAFATSDALPPGDTSGATTETDPYGKATIYHYDTRDRISRVDSPLGYHTSKTYSTNNDVTASVDPTNYTGGAGDPSTTATFTGDNLTKVTTPTGSSVSATYNNTSEPNQPDTSADDRGQSSSYSYSSSGQISSVSKGTATVTVRRQGDSGVTNCGPGSPATAAYKGAVCETRDALYSSSTPSEHRVLYRYDSLGRMTAMTPAQPDNGRTTPPSWSYSYDGQSRLLSETDPRGKTTTYSYDKLDRLLRITQDNGRNTAYSYDADGDRLSVTDYTSTGTPIFGAAETFTYDKLNRLATATPAAQQETITQTWDGNSRLIGYIDGTSLNGVPVGASAYGYNDDGSLTSMSEPGGSCTGYSLTNLPPASSLCILFDVDKAGRRLRTIFPGDYAEQDVSYNKDGKPATMTGTGQATPSGPGTTFYDLTYDYTAGSTQTGHVQVRRDAAGSGNRIEYTYDNNGRLTNAKQYDNPSSGGTNTASWLYCYDAGGNRTYTSTTVGASCPSTGLTTFDGASQQLGTNQSYDLVGDETSTGTSIPSSSTVRTSTWTDTQQLATDSLNGGGALSNGYFDASNSNLISSDNATSTDAIDYGPLGVNTINRTYASTTDHYVAEHDPAGTLVAFRIDGSHYYLLTDNLGSILRVLDNTGAAVDAYHYNPYGTRTTDTGDVTQPFGYTSAYTSAGTGLIHLSARYYDPTLGRFTQPDPQTHPTDTSQNTPYPYAGDDPINHADPNGQWSFSIGGCIGVFVGICGSVNVGDKGFGGSISPGLGYGATVSATFNPAEQTLGYSNDVSAGGCVANACGGLNFANGGADVSGFFGVGAGVGGFLTENFNYTFGW